MARLLRNVKMKYVRPLYLPPKEDPNLSWGRTAFKDEKCYPAPILSSAFPISRSTIFRICPMDWFSRAIC